MLDTLAKTEIPEGEKTCLAVNGNGWQTWNFEARQPGPLVPYGSYEVRRISSPTTGRPAIFLKDPTEFDLEPGALVGEDEWHLRQSIKNGELEAKLL